MGFTQCKQILLLMLVSRKLSLLLKVTKNSILYLILLLKPNTDKLRKFTTKKFWAFLDVLAKLLLNLVFPNLLKSPLLKFMLKAKNQATLQQNFLLGLIWLNTSYKPRMS